MSSFLANSSHLVPLIPGTNITNTASEFHNVEQIRAAWFTLMILGGQVFLPVILITMILSKNVRRTPALINYIVISMEFSISYCLLLYAGHANGPEPPFGLCLTQASFVYASFPAVHLSGFFVVLQVWRALRAITNGKELEEERMSRLSCFSTIATPHTMSLIIMIATILSGKAQPELVTRDRSVFYCSVANHLGVVSGLLSALFSSFTIILEVWTLVLLYTKHDSNLKEFNLPNTLLAFNIRFIKRIFILTVLAMLGFMTDLFGRINPMLYLIYHFSFSLLPIGLAIVLGTQPSILRVWCFWRPRKLRSEVDSYATTFAIVQDGRQRSGTLMSLPIDTKFDFKQVV